MIYFIFVAGKTRTKDKYRVVYSEFQRLELEKEFYCSKYITIKRKGELAAGLDLSERQVIVILFFLKCFLHLKEKKTRVYLVKMKE